jgi:hypothetical protein
MSNFVSKLPMPHKKLEKYDPVGRAVKDQVAKSPTSGMHSPLTRALLSRRPSPTANNTGG